MAPFSSADKEMKINQIFNQLDRKYEEEETQRQAVKNKLPYINLYGFPVDTSALAVIPRKIAVELGLVVFYKEGRNLKLGVYMPSQAVEDYIHDLKSKSNFVELYQISRSSLKRF